MPGVVVGVDESTHAHLALDWAMREAAVRKTELTVLTVIPAMASPWTKRPLAMPDAGEAIERARTAANELVAKSASNIGSSAPESVSIKVFTGFPAKALIEAAADAELVVVGSRGSGGFGELLLGSVSTQVAHHATCPVVIVPTSK